MRRRRRRGGAVTAECPVERGIKSRMAMMSTAFTQQITQIEMRPAAGAALHAATIVVLPLACMSAGGRPVCQAPFEDVAAGRTHR